jgi:hypothetical protein
MDQDGRRDKRQADPKQGLKEDGHGEECDLLFKISGCRPVRNP